MEESEPKDEARQRRDRLRLAIIALILLGTFIIAASRSYPSLSAIEEYVRGLGLIAPLAFILIYAGATLVFIPKNLLSIAAGGLFGMMGGTIFVLVGATLGAIVAFLVARKIGRSSVERLSGQRISNLNARINERPFMSILVGRLIPVVPFTLLNFAAGLSSVAFIVYVGASIIGMFPGTASYVALGAYGTHLSSWELILAILIFAALIMLGRKFVRRSND